MFNFSLSIRPIANVLNAKGAGIFDGFVEASSKLQRTQVAPEADAFTFSEIAGHDGEGHETKSPVETANMLESLHTATNAVDEAEVTTGSRIPFIATLPHTHLYERLANRLLAKFTSANHLISRAGKYRAEALQTLSALPLAQLLFPKRKLERQRLGFPRINLLERIIERLSTTQQSKPD